ncbi:hypothetical protein [Streptomyces anandii]|uniref:hypothetical protein n=1 Tax=Streptomyces anandii TaxID=285454 RepID=UPI000AA8F028|nr:hypothetical protein [Streptomyces anandii]GGX94774.1 hypothetical protein GCM10010510_45050 [Streptomyces anandii JCM 4720]
MTSPDDLKLRLLAREVMEMRLGLAPSAALSVTRAAVRRLDEDARAGRPLVALKAAVLDEVWRRQAVCAVEVAATLQPSDGMAEFTARLRPAYERVVGYAPPADKMPGLVHRLVRDGILAVAPDQGRWNVAPLARKAATELAEAAKPAKITLPGKPRASGAARRALVEADLLAYPEDTVAARARRLGPRLGLKDRAARGQISVITRDLRAAA